MSADNEFIHSQYIFRRALIKIVNLIMYSFKYFSED